jgi:two-component system, LuxR family, sensor kinase FixL
VIGRVTAWRWILTALCVAAALAVLTFACFQLHVNLATTVCLYIVLIITLSLLGNFPVSALASIAAVACLDFFFSRPLYSFEISDPFDVVAISLFLGTSAVITTLVSRLRARAVELRTAVAKLEEQIRERKRTQEVLQQAQDFARVNRVILMGEMTASIAHEVNQPLSGIVANAGTCLRYLAAPVPNLNEVRTHLEFIARDGRRAADVITRVRSLVKASPPQTESLNLNETILEVIELARDQLSRGPITLRTELPDDLPPIPGDRIQLQQVILNLVVNAIDAMSTADAGRRNLTVRSGPYDPGHLFVEVADSGTGFDSSTADRLFNSFYTTKSQGMGMGLSISRLIVEAHGGELTAANNLPHGAIFRFTLPLTPPAEND